MISKEHLPKVQEELGAFFRSMGAEPETHVEMTDEGVLRISLRFEDPGLYIGRGGEGLLALQHLLRIILQRKLGERFFIDLDMNEYKESKIAYLKDLAEEAADEVALTKKEKELAPMPAADRRIIHLELSRRPDVTTESIGEGGDRRVVVKPR